MKPKKDTRQIHETKMTKGKLHACTVVYDSFIKDFKRF